MYTPEEFDKLKQKVLKYVLYKKRSEQEVRTKFQDQDYEIMEDMIEFLKEQKYIDDKDYVRRCINEFTLLKSLSMKEIKYKLYQKGIEKDLVESYFQENYYDLLDYEVACAKKLFFKKIRDMEPEEAKEFLLKKGYLLDSVKEAMADL